MSYKFTITCLKFSSLLFFLLLFQLSFAQKEAKEIGISRFQDLTDIIAQKQKMIGEDFVALIWSDSLIYKKETGDFNSKTVAPIASCSKWLTAVLIMQLVDEGKLSLDDKVSQYIPIFSTYGKNYITIRHCLSHFTGIQSEPIRILKLLERKKFNSLEEEVESFAKKEIQTNPGEEFRYSNIGLNIAGRIAEIVTKRKFDALIKQKLFLPMGMTKTSFSTMDGSAVNPSGGAVSSAIDYLHFLQMLLNNGQYNGKQVLSEAAVKEMRKIQTSEGKIKYAPRAADGFNYALGSWVTEGKNGEATSLSSPGLFGTWPMIDWCRGYACIFFVKNFLGEQKKDVYMEMKEAIDEKVKNKCN